MAATSRMHGARAGAAIALPLAAMTVYLLWLWPRPRGASPAAQLAPYVLCHALGLPFVVTATREPARRIVLALLYLVIGLTVLWIYALAMLCGVRGVCL